MALPRFILAPESTGYVLEAPKETLSVRLDGGASRFRVDNPRNYYKVSVKWSFDDVEYRYWRGFFRTVLGSGAIPFLVDLITIRPDPEEHVARIIPGSVRLQEQSGKYYGVTAQLEAYPVNE